VVGMAATEPLVADDPIHPSNRRISIVLLRGTGEAKPADTGKPPPEAAEKPAEAEESLPGLEEIRRQQLLDGSPRPQPAEAKKKPAEVRKKPAEARREAAIPKEKTIETKDLLPGRTELRRKQLRGEWEPKKPGTPNDKPAAAAFQPAKEQKKPDPGADEPVTTRQLLPGLENIRRKQLLEESRSGLATQSGEKPEDSTVLFPRLEEIRRRRRFE